MIDQTNTALSFGDFQIDRDRRLLLRHGEVVPLQAKAFDVLTLLVQKRGEVLSKNELMDTVWENQFVEENNLTVHVAALRKALGETKNQHKFIVTVPGKGYQFVADLKRPTNGDIVIERRRHEKIVVDEEIVEIHPAAATATSLSAWARGKRFAIAVAFAVAAVLVAGGFALRSQFAAATPAFTRHTLRQLTTNG